MRKIIIFSILMNFTTIVEAKEFETLYLSCTLVKENTNGVTTPVPLRNAKTRDLHEVYIRVKETRIEVDDNYQLLYGKDSIEYSSSSNNYDTYTRSGIWFDETIYFYKNNLEIKKNVDIYETVRVLNEDYEYYSKRSKFEGSEIQYYQCKTRPASIIEKAEELSDKWF